MADFTANVGDTPLVGAPIKPGFKPLPSDRSIAATPKLTPDTAEPIVRRLENSRNSTVVSPKGAVGLDQIEPGTATQYGLDPSRLKDRDYNIGAAKVVLGHLIQQYGQDRDAVLIAYNAGPGVANKWLKAGRNDAMLPKETQGYLKRARGMNDDQLAASYQPAAFKAGAGDEPVPSFKSGAGDQPLAPSFKAGDSDAPAKPNFLVRHGIATPTSPVGRLGVWGAIEAVPSEVKAWWKVLQKQGGENAKLWSDVFAGKRPPPKPGDPNDPLSSQMANWAVGLAFGVTPKAAGAAEGVGEAAGAVKTPPEAPPGAGAARAEPEVGAETPATATKPSGAGPASVQEAFDQTVKGQARRILTNKVQQIEDETRGPSFQRIVGQGEGFEPQPGDRPAANTLPQIVAREAAGGGGEELPPHGPPADRARPPSAEPPRPLSPRQLRLTGPAEVEPEPVSDTRVAAQARRMSDALYRLTKTSTAEKIMGRRFLRSLSGEEKDPRFQQQVYEEIERQSVDPKAPFSARVERFLSGHFGKWRQLEDRLTQDVRRKLGMGVVGDIDQFQGGKGYVHRVVRGRGHYFDRADPEAYGETNPITGRSLMSNRTLSKRASSLMSRRFWVLEDDTGKRIFQRRAPKSGWKEGEPITGPDGRRYIPRRATTAEIEANTPTRYYKNALANTIDNVMRLSRVLRNIQLLDQFKTEMTSRGMLMKLDGNRPIPFGWMETTLPQFRGFAMPSHLAHVLNDFHGQLEMGGDLDRLYQNINRTIVTSMFMLPGGVIAHANNVFMHWIVGRGWDWLRPSGWYSLAVDGTRALKAVSTLDDLYTSMLREGSGLQFGDVMMNNFYQGMIDYLGEEMLAEPQTFGGIVRNLGFHSIGDFLKAESRAMSKALWSASDVMLIQHTLRQMRRGLTMPQAIRSAEHDIPNYRVPSEIRGPLINQLGGGRALAQLLKSNRLFIFGRYKYGLWHALSQMVRDVVSPLRGQERIDAIGKLMALGTVAYFVYPILDKWAKAVTGSMYASVYRRGPFGPISVPGDLHSGKREWVSGMGSILTLSPMLEALFEGLSDKDVFGRNVVEPYGTVLGKFIQIGEALGNEFSPTAMLQDSLRKGAFMQEFWRELQIKSPSKASLMAGKRAQQRLKREARQREKRDVLERWIKDHLP